ncbi:MAG: radical SAM protein [Elusimicrobia bacterium]|nr:radical SAM protein [Elusimicrobiota bacterium]
MINYPTLIPELYRRLSPCMLCPHHCGVIRAGGKTGKCRTATDISVASYTVHHGEEPSISGTRGSGTIFFSNCTLSCVFCQNYPISQMGHGNIFSVDALAQCMIELQSQGAHNINFVTPGHVIPMIVDAVFRARQKGMCLPLVYNSSGYEDLETLKLLEGVIDIYLPDAKYADSTQAMRYSSAENYAEINRIALKEMYRQVGTLKLDDCGIAKKGLIVRHLVLPNDSAGSVEILRFIAKELSTQVHISLMSQYHPAHETGRFPELNRRITPAEYQLVLDALLDVGFENGWQQDL